MKVTWTDKARADLRSIGLYVAENKPVAALALVRRVRKSASTLSAHPHIGRLGRVTDTRELVVTGTAYIIPYRVGDDGIEVLSVLHGAQRWPDDL